MDSRAREPDVANPRVVAASRLIGANQTIGWCSLVVGALTGMVMGLWSFDGPMPVPDWVGAYGETPRRLLRLCHIAFFGLGILNILLAQQLPNFRLDEGLKRLAALSMNIGNVFLPLTLLAASAYHPLKYLMAVPATAVVIALALSAFGAVNTRWTHLP